MTSPATDAATDAHSPTTVNLAFPLPDSLIEALRHRPDEITDEDLDLLISHARKVRAEHVAKKTKREEEREAVADGIDTEELVDLLKDL